MAAAAASRADRLPTGGAARGRLTRSSCAARSAAGDYAAGDHVAARAHSHKRWRIA